MAAQNERLRRELAEARRAAAVAVAAAGSIPLGGGESASTPTNAAETNANPSTTTAAPTVDLSLFASPDARRRRPKRRTAAPGAEELKAFRASELSVGAGDGDALAGKGAKMHDANECAREDDDDEGKDGGEDDDGKENAEAGGKHADAAAASLRCLLDSVRERRRDATDKSAAAAKAGGAGKGRRKLGKQGAIGSPLGMMRA
jgi:hypothetical protein